MSMITEDEKMRLTEICKALITERNRCLGSEQPGFMDADGAVILSHAIRWLSFRLEDKPYQPLTD